MLEIRKNRPYLLANAFQGYYNLEVLIIES